LITAYDLLGYADQRDLDRAILGLAEPAPVDGAPPLAGFGLPPALSPELLADLHEPRLVISADYVGRDRRRPGTARSGVRVPATRKRRNSWARVRDAVLVVAVTAAALVPITLIASHAGGPSISPLRVTQSVPPGQTSSAGTFPGLAPTRTPPLHAAHVNGTARLPRHPVAATTASGAATGTGAVGSPGSAATAGAATRTPPTSCDAITGAVLTPRCARHQAVLNLRAARAAERAARAEKRRSSAATRAAAP
jgi:hypothetical protein